PGARLRERRELRLVLVAHRQVQDVVAVLADAELRQLRRQCIAPFGLRGRGPHRVEAERLPFSSRSPCSRVTPSTSPPVPREKRSFAGTKYGKKTSGASRPT